DDDGVRRNLGTASTALPAAKSSAASGPPSSRRRSAGGCASRRRLSCRGCRRSVRRGGGRRRGARLHLRVREGDPAILRVLRMNGGVGIAAVLVHVRPRRPLDWIGKLAFVENPQPAWTLRNQQAPVGKKRKSPRGLYAFGERFDLERLLLRRDDLALGVCNERRLRFHVAGLRPDERDQLK